MPHEGVALANRTTALLCNPCCCHIASFASSPLERLGVSIERDGQFAVRPRRIIRPLSSRFPRSEIHRGYAQARHSTSTPERQPTRQGSWLVSMAGALHECVARLAGEARELCRRAIF